MKQLMSLTCLSLFCLILSSAQVHAQVSRKGGQGTKVILKKDKNETVESRSENDKDEEVSSRKVPGPTRTRTGTQTYPGRKQEPRTFPFPDRKAPEDMKRLPRRENGRSSDKDYETRRRSDDRDGRYEKAGKGRGGNRAHRHAGHHDEYCTHPGKGKHLGWHKNNKKKNKHKSKHKNH